MKRHSEWFYEVAGRGLSVVVSEPSAVRLAEDFMDGFHLGPSRLRDGQVADVHLKIWPGAPPPLPPRPRDWFAVPGGMCFQAGRGRYRLEVVGSRVEVGGEEPVRVDVWLGDWRGPLETNKFITVMAYALPGALRRCGLFDLHACGMVEPASGVGFIFPGVSGSGKTSLAMRLGEAGWRHMSDDMLAIFQSASGVKARPLRRHYQADAATLAGCRLALLGESLGGTVPGDPSKHKLDPEVLFPGRLAATADPGVLCFPTVSGERVSSVEPVSQAHAMARLVRMSPWASHDVSAARGHLRLLGCLAQQCKTYVLRAGRDIFEDSTATSSLLAAVA